MKDDNPENASRWIAGVEPPEDVRALSMAAIFEKECREQPERLAALLRSYSLDDGIRQELRVLQVLRESPGPVLFLGMGASLCASVSGTVLLQSSGRSSFFADAGEWLHYGLLVWNEVAGTVLVTTSGESAELVGLCRKHPDKPLVLICNNERSTCWRLAKVRFPILAGPEYGNATKTFTNATAACIILAFELLRRDWQAAARQVMSCYSSILDRVFDMRSELREFCAGAANIELVGRGPGYGSAFMGALCIREMTGHRAASHTGAGFRHGPLLDVNESHVSIIFALGRAADLGFKLAQDCNARGGKVVLVSGDAHTPAPKLLPVRIDAVPEPWESVTSILVPQALTLALIEKHGANLKPRFHYGAMYE
jgi:glucosamine--fructose-6-phosphate aminotransferase (isomerizing)